MNLFEHSFSETPVTLDLQRSRFTMNHDHKTTFDQGKLVPVYLEEILPGDTFSVDVSAFVRMSTPVFPVMDNAFLDMYFFFVPSRILWDHFKQFMGENTTAPWTQSTEYLIPKLRIRSAQVLPSSLANYLGIPAKSGSPGGFADLKVNALPFRAYYLIWQEFFRDQNLQYPLSIYTGDNDVNYGVSMPNSFEFGRTVLPVQRYADYFSTALPAPQKGPAVNLPLGASAPVRTQDTLLPLDSRYTSGLLMSTSNGSALPHDNNIASFAKHSTGTNIYDMVSNGTDAGTGSYGMLPRNLFADLSEATASTVNELRQAFAVQRLFERDAIGGTRLREMLKSHFGVTLPDSTAQVPEYLGGFRQPINMDQVVQTSSTDSTSPLATPSGVSVTTHLSEGCFTKSFVEPGYILGLASVRVEHSYSQGLAPVWMRERRFDFYYPSLANIGNQPIFKYEIFASDTNIADKPVFGYKEAWAEYRHHPNRMSGLFGANVNGTAGALQSWVYGDVYNSSPALSDSWIREGSENVKNTLAVSTEPQFLADFYFKIDAYRPMPLYSVPGLIDHH